MLQPDPKASVSLNDPWQLNLIAQELYAKAGYHREQAALRRERKLTPGYETWAACHDKRAEHWAAMADYLSRFYIDLCLQKKQQ
jgi:hypothetical protein